MKNENFRETLQTKYLGGIIMYSKNLKNALVIMKGGSVIVKFIF